MGATAEILGKTCSAPIVVGPHVLSGAAFLAPMSGVTDVVMRRIARRFGASMTVTEMVAAEAYVEGDAQTLLRAEGCGVGLHMVQIAGRSPVAMARAARAACDAGAAIVDLNMGCPAKKVVGGYAGAALMRDLSLAAAIIRAVVAAADRPVTLKMRLGWDEGTVNAPELARIAQSEGVALLTVHGRTRSQFYAGAADRAAIRAVKESVSIPVVANGDCASLADARAMLAASGADGVMIGRAAVGQPWLVGGIARGLAGEALHVPAAARLEAALEHYEGLLRLFGREQGVRHARKHLAAYADRSGAPPDALLRARLVTTEEPREARALLAALFEPIHAEAA
ncbi:tRNA dihydrouridine synthase DusB [Methylocella sp.]|uniref:tRNA dihydrouridine synthase DusB n=1 Tax=Methylocella sp. TaxID=1978226 RepID=UPI003784E440